MIKLVRESSYLDYVPADKVKVGDRINGHEKGWLTVKKVNVVRFGKRIIRVVITVEGMNGVEDITYRATGRDVERELKLYKNAVV